MIGPGTRLLNCCIFLATTLILIFQCGDYRVGANSVLGFAQRNGTLFVMNGKTMNLNGFNAYWMMLYAANSSTKDNVTASFQQASKCGMNIARAWAFSDGGNTPLQQSSGVYNEDMFKGLDFVVSEAKKYGIYVILSFVNNFEDYGRRKQYVEWERERGQSLQNDDEFYTKPCCQTVLQEPYQGQAVLTRINSITGVVYKDDPTIFAWELMNEPHCESDPSGTQIQNWIGEMAAYVKSIDSYHLLEVGLEGFYRNSVPKRKHSILTIKQIILGLISSPIIRFPESILQPCMSMQSSGYHHPTPQNSSEKAPRIFVDRWIQAHIEDSNSHIKKPIIIGEFGKSYKIEGYSLEKRNAFFEHVYDAIYTSAKKGGPCRGGIFWQLMTQGMATMADVVLEDSSSTAKQSLKMTSFSVT